MYNEDLTPAKRAFLAEFDYEMKTTRRVLERLPGDRLSWKPHPKSRSLGRLATHIAELPRWGSRLGAETFEMTTDPAPSLSSPAEILARFDANVEAGRAGIAEKAEEEWGESLTVTRQGNTFFSLPKKIVLRNVLLNHLIHHRGQLSVYLRLNEVPLPPIYGPSADEAM